MLARRVARAYDGCASASPGPRASPLALSADTDRVLRHIATSAFVSTIVGAIPWRACISLPFCHLLAVQSASAIRLRHAQPAGFPVVALYVIWAPRAGPPFFRRFAVTNHLISAFQMVAEAAKRRRTGKERDAASRRFLEGRQQLLEENARSRPSHPLGSPPSPLMGTKRNRLGAHGISGTQGRTNPTPSAGRQPPPTTPSGLLNPDNWGASRGGCSRVCSPK